MQVNKLRRQEQRYPNLAEFSDFVLEQADCYMSPLMKVADGSEQRRKEHRQRDRKVRPGQQTFYHTESKTVNAGNDNLKIYCQYCDTHGKLPAAEW